MYQRWMNRYGPRLGAQIDPEHAISRDNGWLEVPDKELSAFLVQSAWAREDRCYMSRLGQQCRYLLV